MSRKRRRENKYSEWKNLGYDFLDIYDGYIRISDKEYDIPNATVIMIDGEGAFKAYKITKKKEEEAIEFTPQMSKALFKTLTWMKVDWITSSENKIK